MISVNKEVLPHTDDFREACAGKTGAEVAIRAAKALALTGVDIFNNPVIVEKAKEELKERVNTK